MTHPRNIIPAHRLRAQAAAKAKKPRKPRAAKAAPKALVDRVKDRP